MVQTVLENNNIPDISSSLKTQTNRNSLLQKFPNLHLAVYNSTQNTPVKQRFSPK